MANPIKGEVPLDVGGRRYTLVMGTYALAAIERRMGMQWTKIFQRAVDGGWGVDDCLATFHASLLRHHRGITEEQAAEIIDEAGLDRVNLALVEAIKLMTPTVTGGQGAENPPATATNGIGTNDSQIGSR